MRAKTETQREGLAPSLKSLRWWLCILCFCTLISACNDNTHEQKTTISSSTTQSITYSTSGNEVVIRTITGGGLYGTFTASPQVSIYGNGTFILGTQQVGKLSTSDLQQLLSMLVDTYGLLTLKRQQFSDLPDQNATYLELTLNGKHHEMVYGSFGNEPESTQDITEYHQLGAALTALNNTLHGPTRFYKASETALLVHQVFGYDATQPILYWQQTHFTLDQVATFECGSLVPNFDPNKESNCLKYTLPQHAQLLTTQEAREIRTQLQGQNQGIFLEAGNYYDVTLRTLLPDEIVEKDLAMFGSAQNSYQNVQLHQGTLPPVTQ